jgi:hypothetical protein
MTSNSNGGSDDDFITWIIGIIAVIVIGPSLLAKFVPAAQQALVHAHVLVTGGVVIPIGSGAGLDLPRVLLGVGVAALLALLVYVAIRRRLRLRDGGQVRS